MQALGPDTICNIVGFAAGAEIVALLTADRRMRTTLTGPLARKHFRDMSIKRWGAGCRCHYYAQLGSRTLHGGDTDSNAAGDHSNAGSNTRERNANDNANAASNTGTDKNTDTTNSNSNSNSNNASNNNNNNDTNTITHCSTNNTTNTNNNINANTGDEATRGGGDWLAFYLRRLGHRAPSASPLNLLQEHYADDAYRLLSCCILCSRTSGGDTVKDAVERFFELCPTPTSVMSAELGELRETLLPLGLNREIAMKRFAEGFLVLPWSDPSELHGCGRFASDSWQIFCLGRNRPKNAVQGGGGEGGGNGKKSRGRRKHASLDRNLAAYCRFAERRASSVLRSGGGGEGGEGEEEGVKGETGGGRGGARARAGGEERVKGEPGGQAGGGGGGGGVGGRGEGSRGGERGRRRGGGERLEGGGGIEDEMKAAGAGSTKKRKRATVSPGKATKNTLRANDSPAKKMGATPPAGRGGTRRNGGDAGGNVPRKQESKRGVSRGRGGGGTVEESREERALRRSKHCC